MSKPFKENELCRKFLAAFTGPGDQPYINANLYDPPNMVRVIVSNGRIDMTRDEFLSFCEDCVRKLRDDPA